MHKLKLYEKIITLMSSDNLTYCPHCGKELVISERYHAHFHRWGTVLFVILLSLMILALDVVDQLPVKITWAYHTILGVWIFYISTQLIRYSPEYGYIMIPVSGILFSLFFYILDISFGKNDGFLHTDWAFFAIIPVITFVVIFPIVARIARYHPSYYDKLEFLVNTLEAEKNEQD